ncbi:MAG: hypothetical protein AAF414_00800 [Pseudomonadota bacterium]
MIRLHTIIWLSLIAVASAIVFHVSYQVQSLEDELAEINRSILFERESIQVLNAEWAYLTRPDRLRALIDAHTDLVALGPEQIIESVWDIPEPLPNSEYRVAAPSELVARNMPVIPIPRHRPGDTTGRPQSVGLIPAAASIDETGTPLQLEQGSAE